MQEMSDVRGGNEIGSIDDTILRLDDTSNRRGVNVEQWN